MILAATAIKSENTTIDKTITIQGENSDSTSTIVRVEKPYADNPGSNVATKSRVFNINASGATVNISNMTIKGGDVSSSSDYGGGIYVSAGTLNLDNATVTGSKAYNGGGIYVAGGDPVGTLNLDNSTVSNSEAIKFGGGIYSSGTLNINNSTINGNSLLANS
jgi:hypothetical protein